MTALSPAEVRAIVREELELAGIADRVVNEVAAQEFSARITPKLERISAIVDGWEVSSPATRPTSRPSSQRGPSSDQGAPPALSAARSSSRRSDAPDADASCAGASRLAGTRSWWSLLLRLLSLPKVRRGADADSGAAPFGAGGRR